MIKSFFKMVEVLNNSQVINYKKNDIIFNDLELCDRIYFIEDGAVKIVHSTFSEKEEVITYLKKNMMFGDLLIFSTNNEFIGNAICEKDTTIRYITRNSLVKLFDNKDILMMYLNIISNKARNIKEENKMLKHSNLSDRLIHYLTDTMQNRSSSVVKVKNITTLANILSVPRPSLSRVISSLEEKKIIEVAKKGNVVFFKVNK